MAYSNYLISLNGTPISDKYIKYDSYSVLYSTSDLDSYRDTEGKLHRRALPHRLAKIEFETPPMYKSEFDTLMALLSSKYSSGDEYANQKRIANVSAFIPELNDYISADMYVPDITVKIQQRKSNTEFIYAPTRIAFIAY